MLSARACTRHGAGDRTLELARASQPRASGGGSVMSGGRLLIWIIRSLGFSSASRRQLRADNILVPRWMMRVAIVSAEMVVI